MSIRSFSCMALTQVCGFALVPSLARVNHHAFSVAEPPPPHALVTRSLANLTDVTAFANGKVPSVSDHQIVSLGMTASYSDELVCRTNKLTSP